MGRNAAWAGTFAAVSCYYAWPAGWSTCTTAGFEKHTCSGPRCNTNWAPANSHCFVDYFKKVHMAMAVV